MIRDKMDTRQVCLTFHKFTRSQQSTQILILLMDYHELSKSFDDLIVSKNPLTDAAWDVFPSLQDTSWSNLINNQHESSQRASTHFFSYLFPLFFPQWWTFIRFEPRLRERLEKLKGLFLKLRLMFESNPGSQVKQNKTKNSERWFKLISYLQIEFYVFTNEQLVKLPHKW